jgi:FlaA1/EpsC-like NDP-sugar epimerase
MPPGRPWDLQRVLGGVLKYGPAALIDAIAVFATYLLAVGVRTGGRTELDIPDPTATLVAAAVAGALQVVANVLFDIYWRDWSIAALEDVLALAKASALVAVALLSVNFASDNHAIPSGAVVTGAGLVVLVEAALKLRPRWRHIARAAIGRSTLGQAIIVVGAGRTGQHLARDLSDGTLGYRVACFVDDHAAKWGTHVRGIRVAGGIEHLPDLIRQYGASLVVIAMPDPPGSLLNRVTQLCMESDVRIRAVSGVSLRATDTSPLRPIGVEELLAREPVSIDLPQVDSYVRGKVVLVTGAAGSIGSELARQLARHDPRVLVMLDINETGLHDLRLDLGDRVPAEIQLGDVRDRGFLDQVFRKYSPDAVFHAAAYKHVPIVEASPLTGISSNVLGTARVLEAVQSHDVPRFVFISSDKAVRPINVLGLTKRFGELLTVAYAREYGRNYSVVRFGNVLASSGSVIPLFSRQIDAGGPVTVTHAEATRYFMTISEAAGLVIAAAAIPGSGDLFVLDMGVPVSILELAKNMIRLRGLRTPRDVDIRFIGLRPGERLDEALFSPDETPTGTEHPRIMRVISRPDSPTADWLKDIVRQLERCIADQDAIAALDVLSRVVRASDAHEHAARSTNG